MSASTSYSTEPTPKGKILLTLSNKKQIIIDLFSDQTPNTTRNFCQLCVDGYYNGTIFHRVIPNVLVQGGDPTGTGLGGETANGKPLQDEIHSRLTFSRRGLVAMANNGKPNTAASQFFFTLGPTPSFHKQHTIFGSVDLQTYFNVTKLAEGPIQDDERPQFVHHIVSAEILQQPFEDEIIVKRPGWKYNNHASITNNPKHDEQKSSLLMSKTNPSLLSFGNNDDDEMDPDEEIQTVIKMKRFESHHKKQKIGDSKDNNSSILSLSNQATTQSTNHLDDSIPMEDGEVLVNSNVVVAPANASSNSNKQNHSSSTSKTNSVVSTTTTTTSSSNNNNTTTNSNDRDTVLLDRLAKFASSRKQNQQQ
jgi:cyclophilin family peptidyl-prolyl cis-trans isomerase